MAVKYSKGNVFRDMGFSEEESVELKFKADLYVILIRTVRKQSLTSRELEKIWDVPQPRVSEIMTGKLDKVSIGRLLNFISKIGVKIHPAEDRKMRKSA